MQLEEKFWARVMPEPNSGCWLWMGGLYSAGYAALHVGRNRYISAHRFSYELHKGPIPEGFHIDHLCRVCCCVNPDHLEAVVPRVNILRGIGHSAVNFKKEFCKRGHELSGENLHISPSGRRICVICRRIQKKKYRARPEVRQKHIEYMRQYYRRKRDER